MDTRLLLIRHAHVDTAARLCGWLDLPISDKGRIAVETLLRRPQLNGIPDALYTSPLRRAHEIAVRLADTWQVELRTLDAAREIYCGEAEGTRLIDLQRSHSDLWTRNTVQEDDEFAWPGGESYRDFRARVLAGFGDVARAHGGGRVAIVTHAGVISQVLGVIRGRPAAQWEVDRPDPLTATEVTWSGGVPRRLVSFNVRNWL